MGYALRSHLYGCVANGRVVLLDLTADRYFALPSGRDAAMQELIAGKIPCDSALGDLIDRGLVIETQDQTHITSTSKTRPRYSKLSPDDYATPLLPPLLPMLSQIRTKHDLKRRPLCEVIDDVRENKTRTAARRLVRDPRRIEPAIARYNTCRRFISAQDECLRWSIAMVRYLRRHQYFPDLVLGVRMMPFAAHAWVQDGDTVLNDTVDYVSAYTPILVV